MQNTTTTKHLILKKMKTIDKRFETIFEQEQRLKEEAKKLAEKFKDKKPTKYDLK